MHRIVKYFEYHLLKRNVGITIHANTLSHSFATYLIYVRVSNNYLSLHQQLYIFIKQKFRW